MKQHLLITKEMKATMPASTKVLYSVPTTIITHTEEMNLSADSDLIDGDNAIVEDTEENIIAWLKPFDGIWIGDGVPQAEHFTVMHIK